MANGDDPFTWADFRRFVEREFDDHKTHDESRFNGLEKKLDGLVLALERTTVWSKASAEASTKLKEDADKIRTSRLTRASVVAAWATPIVSLFIGIAAIIIALHTNTPPPTS